MSYFASCSVSGPNLFQVYKDSFVAASDRPRVTASVYNGTKFFVVFSGDSPLSQETVRNLRSKGYLIEHV